jgi:large subunit ribosomal protein L13
MIGTRTYAAKKEEVVRRWYVVDATDKHLGRLAVQIARILTGKHRPAYTPHVDTGDFVVVVNAEKIGLTGKKREQSKFYRYSGYPGGLKSMTYG